VPEGTFQEVPRPGRGRLQVFNVAQRHNGKQLKAIPCFVQFVEFVEAGLRIVAVGIAIPFDIRNRLAVIFSLPGERPDLHLQPQKLAQFFVTRACMGDLPVEMAPR
jgi:hypothetical protein